MQKLIPVYLPEIEDGEAPAPDHMGKPQHIPVFSAFGTALRLNQILVTGKIGDGGLDAVFAAKRLIEDGIKRGVWP